MKNIKIGDKVIIRYNPKYDREYTSENRVARKSFSNCEGIVLCESNSHGLCYGVIAKGKNDGIYNGAYYEADELERHTESMEKRTYIECACSSAEHIVRLTYFKDDADEMYLEVHLASHNFMRRLWYAIKYLFGYKCAYGNFQEVVLNKNSVEQLAIVTNEFLGHCYEQNRQKAAETNSAKPV